MALKTIQFPEVVDILDAETMTIIGTMPGSEVRIDDRIVVVNETFMGVLVADDRVHTVTLTTREMDTVRSALGVSEYGHGDRSEMWFNLKDKFLVPVWDLKRESLPIRKIKR